MALPLLEIESFLPLIDHLSNVVCLADKSLHIRGAVSKSDLDALLSYKRMVGTFTLTDSSPDLQGRTISPGTYIRLAQLHNLDAPFFPSLKHLQIVDANLSLTHINLLLSNSLRSIELLNINRSQEEVFSSFLATLADECPELSSIKLTSPLSVSVWENCLKFSHLRTLELQNVLSELGFDLLVTIGQAAPQLEIFILDARKAKYKRASPVALPPLEEGMGRVASAEFSNLHLDGQDHVDPVKPADDSFDPESMIPQSNPIESPLRPEPKPPFLHLETLRITGSLGLIEDLVDFVPSSCLKEIGLTLVRSNPNRPTVTIPRPTVPLPKQTSVFGIGARKKTAVSVVPTPPPAPAPARTQTPIDLDTPLFVFCLERVLSIWGQSLANIFIGQYEDYPPSNDDGDDRPIFPTLPTAVCQKMLLQPNLESLDIHGWTIESFLHYPHPPSLSITPIASSSLKCLHLPVRSINKGLTLSDLRFVAESFPNLVSFKSRIVSLHDSKIPIYDYSKATENVLSHGLETLSVGNSFQNPNPKEVLDVARHIFSLFPKLKEIRTYKGHNEDQWDYIESLVQVFQGVCLDHTARLN